MVSCTRLATPHTFPTYNNLTITASPVLETGEVLFMVDSFSFSLGAEASLLLEKSSVCRAGCEAMRLRNEGFKS